MADNNDTEQPGGPDSAVVPASPRPRRWPRRVLISLVVLVALLAGPLGIRVIIVALGLLTALLGGLALRLFAGRTDLK